MAAGQLAALLPRAVGESRSARVLPGGAVLRAPGRALPRHVSGQHRHPELHRSHRSRRLSSGDRGHEARQPAAADLWPGLPRAVRIGVRSRRQQRRRVHPADEGQGGRALPRRRRLPETRDRAGQRQAGRDRRLRSSRSHRRLLPAHVRSRGRDPRGAGAGRRHAALRDSGLSHATRAARPRARRDPGARNRDPHRRRGRQYRGLPQATTTRCSSASAPSARV